MRNYIIKKGNNYLLDFNAEDGQIFKAFTRDINQAKLFDEFDIEDDFVKEAIERNGSEVLEVKRETRIIK